MGGYIELERMKTNCVKLVKFCMVIVWALIYGTVTWLAGETVYWIVRWCAGKGDKDN